MTRSVAEEILEGLSEVHEHVRGKSEGLRTTSVAVPDVKSVRKKLKMSQQLFAETYRIPVATLRNWEQGRRSPDPATAAYLTVIEKAPDTVKLALKA